MNEEQVRKIVREEIATFMKSDKYVFNKLIQIMDCRNIQLGRTTGTKIGTANDQKLGFLGATPVLQQKKEDHANWAGIDNVVSGLVNLGLFDQS